LTGVNFYFMAANATKRKRWDTLDSLWLCLAIVLHACLFLIPVLHKDHTTASTVPLNITLLNPALIEKPLLEETEFQKTELPAVNEQAVAPDDQRIPEVASLEEPEDQADQEPPVKEVILSTARLLDAASEMEWPALAIIDSRRLGVFVPQPLPENWRSGIRAQDTILNPMVLPNKTEIMDRWLAADGSQNVVINTPGAHTLCGRSLAWDPLQPLVEHVMQFRRCGGGAGRILEMTQRIKRLTVIGSLANSTTN